MTRSASYRLEFFQELGRIVIGVLKELMITSTVECVSVERFMVEVVVLRRGRGR